jgi:predicted nucleotidyltransferase
MSVVGSSALMRITELIVRTVAPDEIFLFGSQAKGTADAHSDVDLLVIGDFRGPVHRRGRELRGLLDRYPLRIDLHLVTRAELAAAQQQPFSWLATLREHAIALYLQTPKRKRPQNR